MTNAFKSAIVATGLVLAAAGAAFAADCACCKEGAPKMDCCPKQPADGPAAPAGDHQGH